MGSPLGKVEFEALGRTWTLKYGHRQKFKAEQLFGCGFIGVVLRMFPGVPQEAILSGDGEALKIEVGVENLAIGAMAMLFGCGLLEEADDDTIDAIVGELGIGVALDLVQRAIAASGPAPRNNAPGEAGAGKAPPKPSRSKPRKR